MIKIFMELWSYLGVGNLSEKSQQDLGKSTGPGKVNRSWEVCVLRLKPKGAGQVRPQEIRQSLLNIRDPRDNLGHQLLQEECPHGFQGSLSPPYWAHCWV